MNTHPKIRNIVEAISRNEVGVALREINSLLNKQKNREKFSVETLETVQLLRGLCQVRSEQFGEAKGVLQDFIGKHQKDTNVDPDIKAWINYIGSSLGCFAELRSFSDPKKASDEDGALSQMELLIKESDFKGVQMAALKLYKDFKKPKYMFISILFQYLSITKAAEAPKDLSKSLEICCMFLTKLMDELKIGDQAKALEDQLNQQIIKLYTEALSKQNKQDALFKILKGFPQVFEDNYEQYFDRLIRIHKETGSKESKEIILERYSDIFTKNNDLDKFKFCYNLYEQFSKFVLENIDKKVIAQQGNIVTDVASKHPCKDDQVFKFSQEMGYEEILGVFWNSLDSSYKLIQNKYTSHHHYKNALKTIITCRIEILRSIAMTMISEGKPDLEKDLIAAYTTNIKEYTTSFLKIFTFADEIYPFLVVLPSGEIDTYLKFLSEQVEGLPEKIRCVADVNFIKLTYALKGVGNKLEDVEKEFNKLLEKYVHFMEVLYDNKKIVEKGERLDNDEYIVILADIVLKLLDEQNVQQLDQRHFSLAARTLYVLDVALEKTPYNFDLKLRVIALSERFCLTERMLDVYKTMDIKAVQLDTLGYIFYKLHSSLHMYEPIEEQIRGNLKYHVESLKESRESLLQCLKYENYEKVEEFYEWDKLMQQSYFKHICSFYIAEHEFQSSLKKNTGTEQGWTINNLNVEYFIEQILTKCRTGNLQSFTFNFDVKIPQRGMVVAGYASQPVVQNIVKADRDKLGRKHVDYLTVLNNPLVLVAKAYRLDIMYAVIQENDQNKLEKLQKSLEGFKQTNERIMLDKFLDFRQFSTRTKHQNLLYLDDKDGYEYSFIEEMVNFELLNQDFELSLISLYNHWLEIVVKKDEKDFSAAIKQVGNDTNHKINSNYPLEDKLDKVLAELSTAFQCHKTEVWKVFMIDLRKLARFVESTLQVLEVVGYGLQNLKGPVTKTIKKFNDSKQFTNLYKSTQGLLKTLQEKVDVAFGQVDSVLKALSQGLKDSDSPVFKDGFDEVEKIFGSEAYNAAQIRKKFTNEFARDYDYLISSFMGKLKERSKSLRSSIL